MECSSNWFRNVGTVRIQQLLIPLAGEETMIWQYRNRQTLGQSKLAACRTTSTKFAWKCDAQAPKLRLATIPCQSHRVQKSLTYARKFWNHRRINISQQSQTLPRIILRQSKLLSLPNMQLQVLLWRLEKSRQLIPIRKTIKHRP